LNVKVKGQGHQGEQNYLLCTPITPAATEWSSLLQAACYSALSWGACVRIVFGKTYLL